MAVRVPDGYLDMVELIAKAYDTDFASVYSALESTGQNNAFDATRILNERVQSVFGLNQSASGGVTAYTYTPDVTNYIDDAASQMNSNTQLAVRGPVQLPTRTTYTDPSAPLTGVDYDAGASTAPIGSVGSRVMAVLDKVALGVAGVSLGAKAGAFIAESFYNAFPDFFDEYLPTMNPQTWDSMATTEGGKSFINMIFGINKDTKETTGYLPAEALAYYMLAMQKNGWFGGADTPDEATIADTSWLPASVTLEQPVPVLSGTFVSYRGSVTNAFHEFTSNGNGYFTRILLSSKNPPSASDSATNIYVSTTRDTITEEIYNRQHEYVGTNTIRPSAFTRDDVTYYVMRLDTSNLAIPTANNYTSLGTSYCVCSAVSDLTMWCIAYLIFNGTITHTGLPEGISHQPGATLPDLSNDDSPSDADDKLRRQFPSWYQNPIYIPTQQPDGSIKDIEYVPVPTVPNPDNSDNPTNDDVTQDTNPTVNPNTAPDTLLETLFRYLNPNPNPPETIPPDPDTGDGTSPAVVIPTGNASSLWSVYNPTQSQVNAFGAWLWSSNFIDQIAKLFLQPMDAIVGIHKVFAPPAISGSSTIVCGYLDSGVPSAVVGNQYTYVDCGTVNLFEYFGNVFDYSPYTSVRLYLPFIGIVPLDVADVMRSSINVRYGVDVITGACLAMVKVTRDGESGGVLYQYGGSCVVHYPHSSGSYMGIVGGIVGLAASALTMIGGGPLGMAVGGLHMANQAMNAHASYQVGGSFSGEPGAMGGKKPYIIVSRPQPKVANSVESFEGFPANYTANLQGVHGFIRVLSCHVHTIKNATENERVEIEKYLKSGVIIA